MLAAASRCIRGAATATRAACTPSGRQCAVRCAQVDVDAPAYWAGRAAFSSAPGGKGKGPGEERKRFIPDLSMTETEDLRPLIPDNVEELLREAEEAIPPAAGYRGSRRKKRQRERFKVIRAADKLRKEQLIAKHHRQMRYRSREGINERLAKLGLPPLGGDKVTQ